MKENDRSIVYYWGDEDRCGVTYQYCKSESHQQTGQANENKTLWILVKNKTIVNSLAMKVNTIVNKWDMKTGVVLRKRIEKI